MWIIQFTAPPSITSSRVSERSTSWLEKGSTLLSSSRRGAYEDSKSVRARRIVSA